MTLLSEITIAVIVAAGIPSAVFGGLFTRWMRKQESLEHDRARALELLFQGNSANFSLAKECAIAIQSGQHNGRLEESKEFATETDREQRGFIRGQAAKRQEGVQ